MLIARGTRKGQTDRPGKKTAKRSSGKGGLHDVRVEVRHDTQCTDLIKDLSGQTTNNGCQIFSGKTASTSQRLCKLL